MASWCENTFGELYWIYHNTEWGRPIHSDQKHFEYLMLECLQCGLNWLTILKKRHAFNIAFNNFNPQKVANITPNDIEQIIKIPNMLKSPKKIKAIINNAKCFLKIADEFGSFDKYIWSYTEDHVYVYKSHILEEIPPNNALSDKIAKDLKSRGFIFVGSITVYAYLQAVGIICDHNKDCPIFKEVLDNYRHKIFDI